MLKNLDMITNVAGIEETSPCCWQREGQGAGKNMVGVALHQVVAMCHQSRNSKERYSVHRRHGYGDKPISQPVIVQRTLLLSRKVHYGPKGAVV